MSVDVGLTKQSWDFGAIKLSFEPPDVLSMQMTPERMKDFHQGLEIMGALGKRRPYYLICDFTHATSIDSKTREEVGKAFKPEWCLGCAYINASVGMKLAVKAMNLAIFLSGKSTFEGIFVKSEAEAHQVIADMRARHRALQTS